MRSPGKRVKSRSVVASIAPCSIASVARCASETRELWACPFTDNSRKISQCRFVGFTVMTFGLPSHSETISKPPAIENGCRSARGFVLMRRKAKMVIHSKADNSGPDRLDSSHFRACSCRGEEESYAYSRRFASTSVTGGRSPRFFAFTVKGGRALVRTGVLF